MDLDEEAIVEFKRLYLKEYGKKLTNEQAIEFGTRLIRLVRAVYGNDLPKRFDNGIKKENNKNELNV